MPIHVDAASGGFVAPFLYPELEWDFRLPLVKSINVSGHKYGLVYAGVGWVIWRSKEDLPEELIFHINYLGTDQPTFTLNFSKGIFHSFFHVRVIPLVFLVLQGIECVSIFFRFQSDHCAILSAHSPRLRGTIILLLIKKFEYMCTRNKMMLSDTFFRAYPIIFLSVFACAAVTCNLHCTLVPLF